MGSCELFADETELTTLFSLPVVESPMLKRMHYPKCLTPIHDNKTLMKRFCWRNGVTEDDWGKQPGREANDTLQNMSHQQSVRMAALQAVALAEMDAVSAQRVADQG